MTEQQMIDTVFQWLVEESEIPQQQFLATPERELVGYHHTLGRKIRNEFKLWERAWTPDIRNGVDYSLDHPDAVSMRVIEAVWQRAQQENLVDLLETKRKGKVK
jgi:hypothetical protein